MSTEISISDELYTFIRDHAKISYSLQVILFFADHPFARFNEVAIIHTLSENDGRVYVQTALRELVREGMLKSTCIDRSIPLYSLSTSNALSNLIIALSRLDMCQRQFLVAHTCMRTLEKEHPSRNSTTDEINAPKLNPDIPERRRHLPVGEVLTVSTRVNWTPSKLLKGSITGNTIH